jgi:hypothetical protein
MRKKPSLFTANERRIALLVLVSAGLLTLGLMTVESLLSPSLGLYGTPMSAPSLPNVIDARPLSRL